MLMSKLWAAAVLVALATASAADPRLQPSPPEPRVPSTRAGATPPAPAPRPTVSAPVPGIDPFVPSETISADASVSFPVDI